MMSTSKSTTQTPNPKVSQAVPQVGLTTAPPKTNNRYVRLVSQDGYEFLILREAAFQSRVLKGFIEAMEPAPRSFGERALRGTNAGDNEDEMVEIPLDLISGNVLDLIVQYLTERYACNASMRDFEPLQQLDPESEEDRKLVMDLLLAADFLEC